METKGKRGARIAALPETPILQEPPAETPVQAQPQEEPAQTSAPAAPNPAEAIAPQIPPMPPEPVAPQIPPMPPELVVPQIPPMPPAITAATDKLADFGSEAFAAIEESRTAVARGFDALSEEFARIARGGVDMAARTAIEMLAVKTVSDAIAVNAGFARASFDNWVGSSAKFSELGVKLAAESSRPFLERLGRSWIGSRRTVH